MISPTPSFTLPAHLSTLTAHILSCIIAVSYALLLDGIFEATAFVHPSSQAFIQSPARLSHLCHGLSRPPCLFVLMMRPSGRATGGRTRRAGVTRAAQ
ncbi:hypothetical protein K523DRAFT_83159 [Schizophyllum commune Tattone D]|nr:hypothetical protein K523DRAFT_83159 [Schizophyllum commune Tattone D]